MRPLDRKLVRDLSRARGQIFSIAAVVACGVASVIAMRSTLDTMQRASEGYYREARLPHVFANLQRAPEPSTRPIQQFLGYTSCAAFGIGLVYFLIKYSVATTAPGPFRATAYDIGLRMFEAYIFPFEMVSILLLAAIVGALLLSGRTGQGRPKLGDEVTK